MKNMSDKTIKLRFGIIASLIFVAALSRLLPHPPNFTPISGMALFGAAHFGRKYMAFLIPLLALWVSSMLLDNIVYAQYYDSFQWFSQPYVFLAIIAIAILGMNMLKKISFGRIIGASLSATVVFFLISNFGVWMSGTTYPMTMSGLIACFAAGVPFLSNSGAEHYLFLNNLIGDLFYTGVLFGSFELIKKGLPQISLRGQRA